MAIEQITNKTDSHVSASHLQPKCLRRMTGCIHSSCRIVSLVLPHLTHRAHKQALAHTSRRSHARTQTHAMQTICFTTPTTSNCPLVLDCRLLWLAVCRPFSLHFFSAHKAHCYSSTVQFVELCTDFGEPCQVKEFSEWWRMTRR